jgi:hypothetical protein
MDAYLLAEANSRTSVKRTENVRIWCQVFVQTLIQKAVWIEFQC